jgi:hypothetical protein
MNFDADRLSRLSGLGPIENTGVLTESKEVEESKEDDLEECCGCGGVEADHDPAYGQMAMTAMSEPAPTPEPFGHSHGHSHADDNEMLFILEAEEEEAPKEEAPKEEAPKEEEVEESAALTMETLRDTVIELRDEILAEQAEERQALAEAPARTAIRREIKALLAEMPADAATNWIYGKKGKPSSAHNKSRATALAGVGFANSKN